MQTPFDTSWLSWLQLIGPRRQRVSLIHWKEAVAAWFQLTALVPDQSAAADDSCFVPHFARAHAAQQPAELPPRPHRQPRPSGQPPTTAARSNAAAGRAAAAAAAADAAESMAQLLMQVGSLACCTMQLVLQSHPSSAFDAGLSRVHFVRPAGEMHTCITCRRKMTRSSMKQHGLPRQRARPSGSNSGEASPAAITQQTADSSVVWLHSLAL